jgi:fibronectin-binding autotransporter adhesin
MDAPPSNFQRPLQHIAQADRDLLTINTTKAPTLHGKGKAMKSMRIFVVGAVFLAVAAPARAQLTAVDWGGSYGVTNFSSTLNQGLGTATTNTGDYTFDGSSDAAYIIPFGGAYSPSADFRYAAPAGKTGPLFTGTMLVNHSSATAPTAPGIYRWSAATDPNQLQRTAPALAAGFTNVSMSTSYFAKKTNFLNGLNTAGPVGFSDQTNGASVSLTALRNRTGVATVGFIAQEGSDWYFSLAYTQAATNTDFSGTITLNPYAADWHAFDPVSNQLVNTSDLGVAKAGSTFTDINAFGILGQSFGFDGTLANSQKFDVTGFSVVASVFGNYWAPTSSGGAGSWATGNNNWATVSDLAGNGRQITTGSNALVFAGTGGTVEVSGTVSVAAGLTFSNNGYTLTNGNVKLTGTNAAANTITTVAGASATIASVLEGTTGLTMAGSGTLTLSGANSYSGGTTLSAGTLRLEHAAAAGSGLLTQTTNNSTLQINTTGTVTNAMSIYNVQTLQTVTLSGNKTLNNATYDVTNGTTTTESGNLTGGGGITKQGTGTLLVTGDNTFTGAVAVNEGVLELASTVGGAAAATTSVSVASGARLLLSQSDQMNDTAGVTLSGGTIHRASGVSEVFGNLNVSSASFLDFGSSTEGTLSFGTYTASALLTVNNFFEGNVLTFGTDLSGSINNTNSFQFDNTFASSWNQGTSTFTITAIPEPQTFLVAAALLGLALWRAHRDLSGSSNSATKAKASVAKHL